MLSYRKSHLRVLTLELFQISAPPLGSSSTALCCWSWGSPGSDWGTETPHPVPRRRSPAGLPHSVSSPNRSHYPQLCHDQRYQAEDWTEATTDGCFSAFCRRRTVLNSWMHDIQTHTEKTGSVETFMLCEQFHPLQDVYSAVSQCLSQLPLTPTTRPCHIYTSPAAKQKASSLLHVLQDLWDFV